MSVALEASDLSAGAGGRKGAVPVGWIAVVGAIAILAALPVLSLFWLAATPALDVWTHLITTVLPGSVMTTLALLIGVGVCTAVIGVTSAWAVTMTRFPGRDLVSWLLLLPLAVPTYVAAYTYAEVLDYSGPVQTFVRLVTGATSARDYWFPSLHSTGGAIVILSFVLYPYVYLTTRATFLMQSACALEVSRTLGAGPLSTFFKVALPLARPAIVVGMTLSMMECLNDIGAVQYLGVRTLTVSIYETWLNRGSLAGAAQIAVAMLGFVVLLLVIERHARRHQRFFETATRCRPLPRAGLTGWRGLALFCVLLLPVALGFGVPAWVLGRSALRRLETLSDPAFLMAVRNTLVLAGIAAIVTVGLGSVIAYGERVSRSGVVKAFARLASAGYAVPATVLAIGILMPVAALDNAIANSVRAVTGLSIGLVLSGSGAALIYAYATRFLTIGYGTVEAGLGRISPHLDMAARTLGRGPARALLEVQVPLVRPAMLTAALLVFVDVMKELPATILLRPFNFETLATTVYNAASQEMFEDSSIAALAIVVVGLLPVILLARTSGESFRDRRSVRTEEG